MSQAITPGGQAEAVLQDAWMRRVARALLRGAEGAEDLAQDAWLIALERRRASGENQRWLTGVLKYRAWASRRASSARAYHEERAGEDRSVVTAAEASEQLELRRRVAEELTALDEPYRTAIYRCVVEGRSLRRTAAELDVTPSTVHARVHEGLARLRRQLDGAYGGERRAWMALTLPWVGRAQRASGLALALGGVAVVGLLAVGASIWRPWGGARGADAPLALADEVITLEPAAVGALGETPGVVTGPSAEALSASDASRMDASALGPASRPALTPAVGASESAYRITGRFLTPSGEPASGGSWTLQRRKARQSLVELHGMPPSTEALEGTLDGAGTLQLAFAPHPAQTYSLTVDVDPWATAAWRWEAIDENETIDLGTVVLHEARDVSGQIVRHSGGALPARTWRVMASVIDSLGQPGRRPWSAAVTSEVGGAFTLPRVPLGSVELVAMDRELGRSPKRLWTLTADGAAEVTLPVTIPGSAMTSISVELNRLIKPFVPWPSLDQVVLISESGERIDAEPHPDQPRFFRFPDVGPGSFRCEVNVPGARPWWRDDVSAGMTLRGVLWGISELRLSVLGPDGEPVTDYVVDLTRVDGAETVKSRIVRGGSMLENGRVLGLVPGDYSMRVKSGVLAGDVNAFALAANEKRAITVVLADETGLRGRVRFADGEVAAGVLVRLTTRAAEGDSLGAFVLETNSYSSNPERCRKLLARTMTSSDGTFSFAIPTADSDGADVDVTDVVVIAGKLPGPAVDWRSIDAASVGDGPAPDEVVELTLRRKAGLRGRIGLAEGVDTTGWQVQVTTADGHRSHSPVRSDGGFDFEGLGAGLARLELRFSTMGSHIQFVQQEEYPYGLGGVPLQAGELTEFVGEFPGAPFRAVVFSVETQEAVPEPLRLVASRTPVGPTVQVTALPNSSESGAVRTETMLLEPGRYRVWASLGSGLAHWDSVEVGAAAPDGAASEIVLAPEMRTDRVRVMVEGAPLRNKEVELCGVPFPYPGDALRTDEDGYVELRLSRGAYTVGPTFSSVDDPMIGWSGTLIWPLPPGVQSVVLESSW